MSSIGRPAVAFLLVASSLAAVPAMADTWTTDPVHSKVALAASYVLVSKLNMTLPIASGTIETDGNAWTRPTHVELHFESAELTTGNAKRDADLRSDRFFDTARYPEIIFVSDQVVETKPGEFIVHGELSMHGVTRELDLRGRAFDERRQPDGKRHVHYEAVGSFARSDYGMTYAKGFVGNELNLDVTIEALSD